MRRSPAENDHQTYNVFTEHAIFNASDAALWMRPGTKYIASVRKPVTQLKSIFREFNIPGVLNMNVSNPYEHFFYNIHKYYKKFPFLKGGE